MVVLLVDGHCGDVQPQYSVLVVVGNYIPLVINAPKYDYRAWITNTFYAI